MARGAFLYTTGHDRAWRLLESPSELENDDWTCDGASAGGGGLYVQNRRPTPALAALRVPLGT